MTALRSRLALALALALAAVSTAQAREVSCEIHSDYDLKFYADRLEFVPESGKEPRLALSIRSGQLYVAGREARMTTDDRQRIARIEHGIRALVPQVRDIALEGVDIAFTALAEVARSLTRDSAVASRLGDARLRIERDLRDSPSVAFDDRAVGDVVEELVSEIVPELVADVVKAALVAAFSGDTARAEALEARADRLERDIQRSIEPRARALEARAEHLCAQVARLDRIEDDIEYRLPDGERLDLLRSGPH